ncbi:histidine kinase N-terminal 7TM domain-containing diguanylate cyclase [Paenibacillus sp. 598K]|uniref:histidine kinase N-terminal 7TM domain-containing diguanylate cyclase n=1 Tax=Paenibacillus sp. 598K TaxID=1117987 RepID=UPI0021AA78FD|nr:diguanylate cyclase [Paenibacillus sp. 598K]
MMWFDFTIFLIMGILFFYILLVQTITNLHKVYLLFHFFMLLWPLGQFASYTATEPQYQVFYISLAFIGLAMIGSGWYLFSIFLSGRSYQSSRIKLILLHIPALTAAAGVIINPNHWFIHATAQGGYKDRLYGPIFYYLIAVLGLYAVLSLMELLRALRSGGPARHAQRIRKSLEGVMIFIPLTLCDLFINVIFKEALPSIRGLTSLGILLAGIHFVLAITRYRVFDIKQIAQQDIVNSVNTGILVIDEEGVVLEVNKVLRPYVNLRVGDCIDIGQFLSRYDMEEDLTDFLVAYHSSPPQHAYIEIVLGHHRFKNAAIYASPIFGHRRQVIGRVITFQNVTELREAVDSSKRQNEVLQDRNRALILMQDELFQANQKLEQMAITDSLTGCFNRRYLMQQLEHEVLTNVRYRIPFAIFLFDIDLFKNINDTYGHMVGDEVLRSTADVVKGALRRTDILARYGGEEFTVYLPHTNREQAIMLADRIKSAIAGNQIAIRSGEEAVSVTVSMGVLAVEETENNRIQDPKSYLRELFTKVDVALYKAKDGGRNRIVIAEET